MDALDLALRGVLFVVFLLAGVAKLRDREGTAAAVVAFGVPQRLARPVSVLLPAMELVTAGLLVSSVTALAGALTASALLATFTVVIAVSLAHGRRPPAAASGRCRRSRWGAGRCSATPFCSRPPAPSWPSSSPGRLRVRSAGSATRA